MVGKYFEVLWYWVEEMSKRYDHERFLFTIYQFDIKNGMCNLACNAGTLATRGENPFDRRCMIMHVA